MKFALPSGSWLSNLARMVPVGILSLAQLGQCSAADLGPIEET
jgi:hypothetical protein